MAPPSPFLELSGDGDHDHQYHHIFNLEPQTSFSSSSLSSPVFVTPAQLEGRSDSDHYREPQKFQFQLLEADNIVSYGGSCDHDHQTLGSEGGNGTALKLSLSKNGADHRNVNPSADHESGTSSVKWMSSKMRMMRKMTNPDQTISSTSTTSDDKPIAFKSSPHKFEDQKVQNPSSQLGTGMISCSNNSSNNMNNVPVIRVCSDCNTTKTPLWRSGPRGPKSLCNACGIRQRKARRAMAAAVAAANGTTGSVAAEPSVKTSKVQHKENKPRVGSTVPFKKRPYKLTSPSSRGRSKKLCFEDFTISMNNNNSSGTTATTTTTTTTTATTALQRVFPQDEKEAAILLMALSCGLVHG